MLDENWLRSKLIMALAIESRDGVTELTEDVWRLGESRRELALLSRSLLRLWAEPAVFDWVRVAVAGVRVIARDRPRRAVRRSQPGSSASSP